MSARMTLFAEFGLGDEYGAQTLRRDQQRFDLADRLRVDKRRTAGQIANLGEKVARLQLDDCGHMPQSVSTGDSDRAGKKHEHSGARFTS